MSDSSRQSKLQVFGFEVSLIHRDVAHNDTDLVVALLSPERQVEFRAACSVERILHEHAQQTRAKNDRKEDPITREECRLFKTLRNQVLVPFVIELASVWNKHTFPTIRAEFNGGEKDDFKSSVTEDIQIESCGTDIYSLTPAMDLDTFRKHQRALAQRPRSIHIEPMMKRNHSPSEKQAHSDFIKGQL